MVEAVESLRTRIYRYVQGHPATHILEIAAAFRLAHPTVMYHLRILEDEGYVISSTFGKRRAVYDTAAHFSAWEREILALLHMPEAWSIVEYVATHPGSFPREIAERLGISETTAKKYTPELMRLGVVDAETGFRRRMRLSPGFVERGVRLVQRLAPDLAVAHRLLGVLPALAPSTEASQVVVYARPPEPL